MTMTTIALRITGGVDTHLDVHVAAALDERGALLGVESFSTTTTGYRTLRLWLESFGTLELVGVEGTGSYGAGLTRHLLAHDVTVVEVDRPNRQRRRRKGKSDPEDAVAADRSAQGGDATGSAKSRDGNVEAMRVLRVTRLSARSSRTQAINQMRSLISTAPDELRDDLRDRSIYQVLRVTNAYRHTGRTDVITRPSSACGLWPAGPSRSKKRSKRSTGCSRASSPGPLQSSAPSTEWAPTSRRPSWSPPATTPSGSRARPLSPSSAGSRSSTSRAAK
jgi:Transposase